MFKDDSQASIVNYLKGQVLPALGLSFLYLYYIIYFFKTQQNKKKLQEKLGVFSYI